MYILNVLYGDLEASRLKINKIGFMSECFGLVFNVFRVILHRHTAVMPDYLKREKLPPVRIFPIASYHGEALR